MCSHHTPCVNSQFTSHHACIYETLSLAINSSSLIYLFILVFVYCNLYNIYCCMTTNNISVYICVYINCKKNRIYLRTKVEVWWSHDRSHDNHMIQNQQTQSVLKGKVSKELWHWLSVIYSPYCLCQQYANIDCPNLAAALLINVVHNCIGHEYLHKIRYTQDVRTTWNN